MTKEEIKKLFPKTCLITQDLIGNNEIGGNLLKTFIPEELWENMFWGLSIGTVGGVDIETTEEVESKGKKIRVPLYLDTHITEPREITFELRKTIKHKN